MVTIKDIARKANVSITTVSKVMNNYSDISEETKKKVQKIIEDNNYRPNANARSLSTNKSYSIGLFFKDHQNSGLRHPFFRDIIYGLEQEFCNFGYDLILFSNKWGDKFKYLEKCNHRKVDGAILMGMPRTDADLKELLEAKIPSMFIDLDILGETASYVMSNNVKGAKLAVKHLYELGHRKIATIMGENMTKPAQDRLEGYKEALKEYDIPFRKEWSLEGEFSEKYGFKSMQKLIEQKERPTAIFCQGDQIAIGAIKAIHKSKYDVPADFSVIGFDDIEISRYIEPQLTTIQQNKFEMGKKAAKQLINIINHPEEKYSPVILPTKLVKRKSCRKI